MGIRVYKPTTNGRRNMTSLDFTEITTSTPEKSLLVALKSKAGRNNKGRITVRHQGGGHKRFYRLVDFNVVFVTFEVNQTVETLKQLLKQSSTIQTVLQTSLLYTILTV